MFKIVKGKIKLDKLIKYVSDPGAGAITTFLGVTRGESEGRKVIYLDYDAYQKMAEKKMEEIGDEIKVKWKICKIAIIHRVGRLKVGEASVAIAVSTPHRREGFQSCKYAIDRIKEITPVWKKEVWKGGEEWKGGSKGSSKFKAQSSK